VSEGEALLGVWDTFRVDVEASGGALLEQFPLMPLSIRSSSPSGLNAS
jgi:hypothetical protein